jgi:hypothetical protein
MQTKEGLSIRPTSPPQSYFSLFHSTHFIVTKPVPHHTELFRTHGLYVSPPHLPPLSSFIVVFVPLPSSGYHVQLANSPPLHPIFSQQQKGQKRTKYRLKRNVILQTADHSYRCWEYVYMEQRNRDGDPDTFIPSLIRSLAR